MFREGFGWMVSATRVGRDVEWFNQGSNMSERKCLACGIRPAATDEGPALCEECLERAGEPVTPRTRVVCTEDGSLSGTVDRIEDDLLVRTI